MKKYFFILFLPFFAFSENKLNLSDAEIQEKIIGKWNMVEAGGQANVVTYYDDGIVTLKVYICNNDEKKASYEGEEIRQYKIKDGYLYLNDPVNGELLNKLKIVKVGATAELIYDAPDHVYDKWELYYFKTPNIDVLPLCKYNLQKLIDSLKEKP